MIVSVGTAQLRLREAAGNIAIAHNVQIVHIAGIVHAGRGGWASLQLHTIVQIERGRGNIAHMCNIDPGSFTLHSL